MSKRPTRKKPPSRKIPEQPAESLKELPPVRFEPWALGFAALYIGLSGVLLYSEITGAEIGAVCDDGCGGATWLGVPLSLLGILSMASVAGFAALAWRRAAPAWKVMSGAAALAHAGASWAFASHQWLGTATLCVLCQVAALLSASTAALLAPGLGAARRPGLLWGLAAPVVGAAAALLIFPHLEGVVPEPEVIRHVVEVAPAPADPEPTSVDPEVIQSAIAAASIGSPEARFELMVLTDFSCGICERFEKQTLPPLIESAVEPGHLRVQFLFIERGVEKGRSQIIAATAAAMAGVPFPEAVEQLRPLRLNSIPQGIHVFADQIPPEKGLAKVQAVIEGGGWDTVMKAHTRLANSLSDRYLGGRRGSPAFVLFDRENPARTPYGFYGYQRPGPFLEYMGIEGP